MPDDPRELSYGLTPRQLSLEPLTLEVSGDLDLMQSLMHLTDTATNGVTPLDCTYRVFDMALALYAKLIVDNAFDGLDRNDIFAAALHTANIWEFG